MYFVPLSQLESVELAIHCLRAAGGLADCTQCPAYKVCTKQCLTIADAVSKMLQDGTLPQIGGDPETTPGNQPDEDPHQPDDGAPSRKRRLKIVK